MSVPDRSDKKAFAEYAAGVMKGWVEGRALEYRPKQQPDLPWSPAAPVWAWNLEDYRLAPEPPSITPWTFETSPNGCIKARRKSDGALFVSLFYPSYVRISEGLGSEDTSYATFARDFEQLNGEPCGVKAEAEWPKWFRNASGGSLWKINKDGSGTHYSDGEARSQWEPGTYTNAASLGTIFPEITAAEAEALLKGVK